MCRILGCLIGLAIAVQPIHASAEMQLAGSSGQLKVIEIIKPNSGSMSGTHRHRIRTDNLFAGFHLIDETGVGEVIDIASDIKLAPVWLPGAVRVDDVNICAEIRSVNGFYEARVSTPLKVVSSKTLGLQSFAYESDLSQSARRDLPEDFLLPRVMIADECDALQSSFYVPVSWSDDPSDLLIVIEIGGATLSAEVFSVGRDERVLSALASQDMDCERSEKVEAGFDCYLPLDALPADLNTFEVVATINRPGVEAAKARARFSLPRP